MAAGLPRVIMPAFCVSFTGMPDQNDAIIPKPLVPNPH